MLTVIGFVVVVPLGWSLILGFGLVNPNVLVLQPYALVRG